jgi:hypothetical protein
LETYLYYYINYRQTN